VCSQKCGSAAAAPVQSQLNVRIHDECCVLTTARNSCMGCTHCKARELPLARGATDRASTQRDRECDGIDGMERDGAAGR
jgi:hypothetical protein